MNPTQREASLIELERLLRALAERTRLRLLNLMAGQEVCVCFFVEILQLPQPTISRHLSYLRRAGLVAARREGKWMHYRISAPKNPIARRLLKNTLKWLAGSKEMQRDRSCLTRASCAPQTFVNLQGAPRPVLLETAGGKKLI